MRTKVKNDSHLTPFHQKEIISTIFECINNKFQYSQGTLKILLFKEYYNA